MENWSEKLQQLQEQTVEKHRLEKRRDALKKQLLELEEKEYALRRVRQAEEEDVTQLQGRSLAVWFYTVTGQKNKKLEKEEREAMEAAVRHDAVAKELQSVQADLKEVDLGLRELVGCETRYRETVEAKKEAIRHSDTAAAAHLTQLEQQLLEARAMQKELREAVRAGQQARSTAQAVLDHLDSAEGWGTWDLLGGGLISDLAKHEHLDSAQSLVESLQVCLRQFKTELNDVSLRADMQVSVEGYLRFADFFFDGLFSSWAVLDQIGQSKMQVRDVDGKIGRTLHKLYTLLDKTEAHEKRISSELQILILDTNKEEI